MIGKSLFDFLDPASWSMAERSLQRRRQGYEDRREVELLRKDGTKVWVLGWANPIFDANGEYAGALGVLGDLSVQKERERELRAEIADLRRRLAAGMGAADPKPQTEAPSYREPFRSAVVVATCSAFVATVALAGACAVLGSLFGVEVPMSSDTFL
jgi:PAS domain-containing protein